MSLSITARLITHLDVLINYSATHNHLGGIINYSDTHNSPRCPDQLQ